MIYTKPEVELLGGVNSVIECIVHKMLLVNDGGYPYPNSVAAYDLDE